MLGPLAAYDGDHVVGLGGPRQRTVLALLLVDANKVVTTDRLVDELYGEEPPDAARKSLQSYIANLRKAVNASAELLQGRPPGYMLEVDSSQVDALVFERLVLQARALLDGNPAAARQQLTEALALWYGAPLIDVADEAPSLRQEVAKFTELRLVAIEDRVEADLALGQHQAAVVELESLIVEHPLRERFWGQIMLALYRSGRQAEALRAYQKARRVLGEELGIEPSPALTELEDRILAHDVDLELAAPVAVSLGPASGRTVRGYELRESLGTGRLGTLYRAFQPAMAREVALEVADGELAATAEFARRFEADAAAIARLEHPHIVPLYDYWREPGGAFVVSRWMRGGSLGDAIRKGPWRFDAVARLIEQVGSALESAARQGAVHGNVVSSSILLDEEGNAYLSDFAIGFEPSDLRDDCRGLASVAYEALSGSPVAADGADEAIEGIDPSVLTVLQAAISPESGGGFSDVGDFVESFLRSIGTSAPPAAISELAAQALIVSNPYKGLRSFDEADADNFFGREALTELLVRRLNETGETARFLAVVGPSGSGKSSGVRAGLIPVIRRGVVPGSEDWYVVEMLPSSNPWEELEAALLRVAVNPPASLLGQLTADNQGLHRAVKRILPGPGAELLLIVDQFEELFTLVEDDITRDGFMDGLVAAVRATNSQLRVVVTLRADFYDRPLRHSGMAELVTDRMETVRPLARDELERAITGPAERVGLVLEPTLEARIAADVAHQPGALPLLQYTLAELFDRRDGATLTLQAYRALGGVQGALGKRAEELYAGLDPAARMAARQVFLRLVSLGEGTSDTRRRVLRSELVAIEGQRRGVEIVLDVFGTHRLLSFDRDPITRSPTAEVAHEALLTEWSRLRQWIDDGRTDLRYEKSMGAAAAEWEAADHDPSFLLTGGRLRGIEAWQETSQLALTRAQSEYLDASLRARQMNESLEADRLRHEDELERRSQRRLRLLVAVFAVATVLAGTLALVAWSQARSARHNLAIASARELTAESIRALDSDVELSLLLAIEAADNALDAEEDVLPATVEALHQALLASRVVLTVPGGSGAFSPDGSRLVTADPGTFFAGGVAEGGARVYSITGDELLVLSGHGGRTLEAYYSPDGSMIATTGLDGTAHLWNATSGTEITVLEVESAELYGAAFSGDGALFAIGASDGNVRLLDTTTGEVRLLAMAFAEDIALSDTGLIAVAADTAGAVVANVASGEQLLHLTGHRVGTCRVDFSPDGTMLATAGRDGTAKLWDVATGDELRTLVGHAGPVCGLAFSPDGDHVATGGEDGTARVWEVATGEELLVVSGHGAGIGGVTFDPTGRLMATAGGDGHTKIWDISPAGSYEQLAVSTNGPATFSAYSPNGAWLGTATEGGAVEVWDTASGERHAVLSGHTDRVSGGGFSPDGTMLVTSGEDQTARVWDVASGRQLFVVTDHLDTVWSSTFSPDGSMVATASLDGRLGLWGLPDGREIVLHDGSAAFSVTFNPDGSLIAVAGLGLQVWDVATFTQLVDVAGHPGAILAARFSPDGDRLATAAADGSAKLWDVADAASGTLTEITALQGHSAAVLDVIFSPDGSRIATAALDDTVKIWDDSGGEVLTLPVRTPGVLAFDPTGALLAVPSADGSVRIYVMPVDQLLDLARSRLTRSFTDAECVRYLHDEACSAT